MKTSRRAAHLILSFSVVAALTSCGVSSAPFAEEDYCKPVMKIVASFTDLLISSQDNESAYMSGTLDIVAKLETIASEMPSGEARNFVMTLAEDYRELSSSNANMEAMTGLTMDLTSKKMGLVCPQMYP